METLDENTKRGGTCLEFAQEAVRIFQISADDDLMSAFQVHKVGGLYAATPVPVCLCRLARQEVHQKIHPVQTRVGRDSKRGAIAEVMLPPDSQAC